ncbi:class I SAM-dependent DNA methyltransferase [Sphingomonas insulae]|uniref:class I SAM-dependent DNA methyltransferase n=1 Tax=Sphingomonas insulae TaxID=424800 RepID=UPI0013D65331|nr:class I SAM-dependent DNA methyltransferase [Sphingomonas insulae]
MDEAIERFVERWRRNEGGAERANFPLFLTELCALLDLPPPDPADATHARNDYVFERAVTFPDAAGSGRHGRIDLYRKGSFVLEAKQSRERGGAKEVALGDAQATLPGIEVPRGRRSAHRGWDVLMRNAREQAEQYARALPESHGWPPFILVVDVGHAIEVFADFSGQGKNYRQFPDRAGFRIYLDDLRDPAVRERLRAIWLEPQTLDPSRHAAKVTRDIAGRLANVSKRLEDRGHAAEPVAHFLMRCLFTMFAEDTGLLEPGSFSQVLTDALEHPDTFAPMLEDLWRTMDTGGFSALLRRGVRRFNGGLFADCHAIPLEREEIGELCAAARHDWRDVEPAIFGTMLEQALDRVERRRLGAHYTPRAYVERLVIATIIEPLQREWESVVLGTVERERTQDVGAAIRAVHEFHERLAATRVLDPACGTGNFLYVALELMKRLEGDVLEVLADLGGQEALALETATVHPQQFLGIELNPRAAIAELVLWLGYLQWQLRNRGVVADPVLERLDNIVVRDAVLGGTADRPRRPDWPEADYIVGNPPFIGGKDLRGRLGDAYATALWKAHPKINRSADFVMYWWDRAAERLTETGTRLKRFGFVTTNSITQDFSRRVIARRLAGARAVSLTMAVPDHPWTKASRDAAAVRIAMTVAEAGAGEGTLLTLASERGLRTDAPQVEFNARVGTINADLGIGASSSIAQPLMANGFLSVRGVEFHGDGYVIASKLRRTLFPGGDVPHHCRRFMTAGDLKSGQVRPVHVLDLHDLDQQGLRRRYPAVYQHLLTTAKPSRANNPVRRRREEWWKLALPHAELRDGTRDLRRYIGTIVTAKYRLFAFIDGDVMPDQGIMAIVSDDAAMLGVLNARVHVAWALASGGTLEDRPRYNNTLAFDPFPFPDLTDDQAEAIGDLAEELDATRKAVLAEHDDLTLTGLYNVRERIRSGAVLTRVDEDRRRRGRVDILIELHDRIDVAVADAYGWPTDLDDAAIVARLIDLNLRRRAEERGGRVRWLRPDYQIARAGLTALPAGRPGPEQIEAMLPAAQARKPAFPRDAIGQTAAVLAALRVGGPATAEGIARRHAQGRRVERRVQATLEALERLGHVANAAGGFVLRRAA